MSAGVVANKEAEKARPGPTEHADGAAAEPTYADQSTRLLPPAKIVIVRNISSLEEDPDSNLVY